MAVGRGAKGGEKGVSPSCAQLWKARLETRARQKDGECIRPRSNREAGQAIAALVESMWGMRGQASGLAGWSHYRRSGGSLGPFIWRFRDSSLKVVTELGTKVHILVETPCCASRGRKGISTHGGPTAGQTQRWALHLHNRLCSSKQPGRTESAVCILQESGS